MADEEVVLEIEAAIIKKRGIVLPSGCGCVLSVICHYPDQPWYWVKLNCRHDLRKLKPNKGQPHDQWEEEQKLRFDWFTIEGELVPLDELAKEYDKRFPNWSSDILQGTGLHVHTREGYLITRFGGVYILPDYDMPGRAPMRGAYNEPYRITQSGSG